MVTSSRATPVVETATLEPRGPASFAMARLATGACGSESRSGAAPNSPKLSLAGAQFRLGARSHVREVSPGIHERRRRWMVRRRQCFLEAAVPLAASKAQARANHLRQL